VDDIGVPPPFNPKQVLVNGAAVGLISALVESVRDDMRSMEERVTATMAVYWDAHNDLHDRQEIQEMDNARRTRERLSSLERWQIAEQIAAAAEVARIAGEQSFYRGATNFLVTNQRWLLSLIGLLIGVAAAWLGSHVQ
jgi:uncharacterized Zn finger protein